MAPHGSDALARTAWAKVWMLTTTAPGPPPLTSALGSAKYFAAPRTSPWRRVVDHALMTATAAAFARFPVGGGVGISPPSMGARSLRDTVWCAEWAELAPDPHADVSAVVASAITAGHVRSHLMTDIITDTGRLKSASGESVRPADLGLQAAQRLVEPHRLRAVLHQRPATFNDFVARFRDTSMRPTTRSPRRIGST